MSIRGDRRGLLLRPVRWVITIEPEDFHRQHDSTLYRMRVL